MTQTKLRLKKTAAVSTLLTLALAFQGDALAAGESVVPASWNVSPITNGAYREAFELTTPTWAQKGASANTADATQSGAGPLARANTWFSGNSKVLVLDTDTAVATNMLTGANTYGTEPIYIDMRVKFTAMSETPAVSLTDNVKLGIYLNAASNLVAVHSTGVNTDTTARSLTTWYQLTIKMRNDGKYDVLLDDAPIFTGLTLKSVGTGNTLAGIGFNGTGRIDELYVSHGDPKNAPAGATTIYPVPSSNSDTEKGTINTWLGTKSVNTLSMTEAQLNTAYLVDSIGTADGIGTYRAPNFGIQSFELIAPTTRRVTFKLTTGGTDKSGTINGKIQLYGRAAAVDPWTAIGSSIAPTFASDGTVTPTDFENIPATYRFFKPQIIP